MSDIFVSYSKADRGKAEDIAAALKQQGFSVWWDRRILPGEIFDTVIEAALDAASCVIVLWSRTSVVSEWVRAEASEGKQRGILIPVLIDEVKMPLAFRQMQFADLRDWEGTLSHPGFDSLLEAVTGILGRSRAVQPGQKPKTVRDVATGNVHSSLEDREQLANQGNSIGMKFTLIPANEIKIGVVAPLTGGASKTGLDMWQAAELAKDEINAQGGVNVNGVPMQIKLIQGDTGTSPETGVKVVTKLITEDEVDLLIGGFSSGITYADSVVAAEHKVPFIITGASSPIITHRTDIDTSYFFHQCQCPTTDDYGESTILFVDEVVKPEIYERFNFAEDRPLRLAVLYQDSAYGSGVYDGITKTIEKNDLNMEVVKAEKFKMSETDFRTVLTVIKAANPDVVYPAAFVNEQTVIVTQGRRDVGLDTIYLSVECNDDPDYYTGVERWGEYSIQESRFSPYTIPAGDIHDAVVQYKEDFEAKWGVAPSMMGASTYEGVYIAAEAIKNAGTVDKEKVREALVALEMPQIVEAMQNGVITFSPDYRESKFELYMQQLIWEESVGETRPMIVWPDSVKETDFVLPDWYEPGSP
jgi:branched-chain amino acid transport system substrate-binding protein